VGIESGGDNEKIGAEREQRWKHSIIKGCKIFPVSGSRRKRNIHGVSFPRTGAMLVPRSSAWIERIPVQTDVQNACVVLEDVLRSVPVVDIPIKNRNVLPLVYRLSVACTHGYIVEEAEAHRLITLCMVSWRSDRTECRIDGSVNGSINGAENAPSGKERNVKGLPDGIGVSPVKEAASTFTGPADVIDMMLRVNSAKLVGGSRSRIQVYEVLA
jgi:hypothetical protein